MAEFKNLTICSNPYGISNASSSYTPYIYIGNASDPLFGIVGSRNVNLTFPSTDLTGTASEPLEIATGDFAFRDLSSSFTQDYLVDSFGKTGYVYKDYSNGSGTTFGPEYLDSYMRIKTYGSTHMEIHAGRIPFSYNSGYTGFTIKLSSNAFKWVSAAHFTPTLVLSAVQDYKNNLNDATAYSEPLANTEIPGQSPFFYAALGSGQPSNIVLSKYSIDTNNSTMTFDLRTVSSGPYAATADVYYFIILTDQFNNN